MKTNLYLSILAFFVFSFFNLSVSNAQNLIDMQAWQVGQGSVGGFSANGQSSENIREWGIGPNGKLAILWKGQPEGFAHDDGGFTHTFFNINHANMYRYAIWLKKTNSNDGVSYFGTDNVSNLNGQSQDNPYFWSGDLPELNKWYLLVAYVHGSGDASTTHYGGIYDGVTGTRVADVTDFKFATSTTTTTIRSYLFYDANVNDKQFFYAPRVDVVNGSEPSIESLLNIKSLNAEQGYFAGSVGIKTQDPGAYDLAVNGKIRSREIKVETANWPDYVFADNYQIPSLAELEKYIKANKHLPGIPSATEVEKNGIELGEMNKLLLKKIEELSIILIQKDKKMLAESERLKKVEEKLEILVHQLSKK
ncbi:hypothetical protein FA048_00040 [Pedobacter polaris]|uniref:LamG domain-containing protein n=1 Tax=Pedobacter polaris TaxID=2571273 RepID=A0A4U1CTC8_9SPHI|nr:hypothetical protein [Pedobacter polaris]TKC12044.1 hypothetical protein FA048_00040 [Pedobacter polaris]